MNILQALKKIKHNDRKIAKIQTRISKWCSHEDNVEPAYDIKVLMQSVTDLLVFKAHLINAIRRANVSTVVQYKDKPWSLDMLIGHRTTVLPGRVATLTLLRRKEKERGFGVSNQNDPVKMLLNYDPKERDKELDAIEDEMSNIDTILDETNIATEVME